MSLSRYKAAGLMAAVVLSSLGLAGASVMQKTDAESELRRVRLNSDRLLSLHPWMQPKIAAVLSDLEKNQYRPLIDVGVWRDPKEQAKKVRLGYSKTLHSFHTNTIKGRPASYAADITDVRWGWSNAAENTPFWLKLASSAESHRCVTGIYWGLSESQRARLRLAIATKEWTYRGPRGWDTAHAQPHYFTISEARQGKLPR